jgi:hypothetical protein
MAIVGQLRTALDALWVALDDLKQPVTIRRITRGAYDPATGVTSENVATATVQAVLTNFSAEMVDGTDIRAGDLNCIVLGKTIAFRPEQGDSVELPTGQTWRVMQVRGDTYAPSLYHELVLRR